MYLDKSATTFSGWREYKNSQKKALNTYQENYTLNQILAGSILH
jgi:hypothetical protein